MTGISPWTFDLESLTLQLKQGPSGNVIYEVDLSRCRTSAEVLDWIVHVAHKAWADDVTLAWLVRDLDALLDARANLCSGGEERGPIDPEKVARERSAARSDFGR